MAPVLLEDVVGTITSYASAVAGKEVMIVSEKHETSGDEKGTVIYLPELSYTSNNPEDDFLLYKIRATLEAACLRHAEEGIGTGVEKFLRQRKVYVAKDRPLEYHLNDSALPKGYKELFEIVFSALEFGRIRRHLAGEYPALDEDIDSFLAENQRYLEVQRISNAGLSAGLGKHGALPLMVEQEKAVMEMLVGFGYLLLFNSEEKREEARKKVTPNAESLYDEVSPQLLPGSSRAESAELSFALVERLWKDYKNKLPALQNVVKNLSGYSHLIPLTLTGRRRLERNLAFTALSVEEQDSVFLVDEWDAVRRKYLPDVCQVREQFSLPEGLVHDVRFSVRTEDIWDIKDALEILLPEGKVETRHLSSGELDMDAWVKYRTARMLGSNPLPRFYRRVERIERDVAQLILWDIGGSCLNYPSRSALAENMRTIDMMKYGLLQYLAAVRELGDDVALLAYNSRGRNHVYVYPLIAFGEDFSLVDVASSILKVHPRDENLDGAAIRHALYHYLAEHTASTRVLFHLNDGIPEDKSHGLIRGRGSIQAKELQEYAGKYAIEDVKKALEECREHGVLTFGLSFAREDARDVLQSIWGTEYKMLKTPFSLGKKLAEVLIEKTKL